MISYCFWDTWGHLRQDSIPSLVFTCDLVDVLLVGPPMYDMPNRAVNPAARMDPRGPMSTGA